MKVPRCGREDTQPDVTVDKRQRRYVLMSQGWSRLHLTYRIEIYSRKVSHKEADIAVAKAFKVLVIAINILTLAYPFKLTDNLIELNAKV